jgi:hypothetical protein
MDGLSGVEKTAADEPAILVVDGGRVQRIQMGENQGA